MIDAEHAKTEIDAFGVGVRAGALTPSIDEERHFRGKLVLPSLSADVEKAWQEDGGVRRPITIAGSDQETPNNAPR